MAVCIRKSALRRITGFTLAELLIAVSIIAILALAGLSTMQNQTKRARDQRRAADLEQIRSALEMYRLAQTDRLYPLTNGNVQDLTVLQPFIAVIPDDPITGRDYMYQYTGIGATYNLCAYMETGGNEAPGNSSLCGNYRKCYPSEPSNKYCDHRLHNP